MGPRPGGGHERQRRQGEQEDRHAPLAHLACPNEVTCHVELAIAQEPLDAFSQRALNETVAYGWKCVKYD